MMVLSCTLDLFIFALTMTSLWNGVDSTTDFYHDHWQCNHYLSAETINVRPSHGKLLELHIRDNIQGEVEIRDGPADSTNIRIEIEKLGMSESQTESIIVNQTYIDVGHGTILMLQLDYVARPKRRMSIPVGVLIGAALVMLIATLLLCRYHRKSIRSSNSFIPVNADGISNFASEGPRHVMTVFDDGSPQQQQQQQQQQPQQQQQQQQPDLRSLRQISAFASGPDSRDVDDMTLQKMADNMADNMAGFRSSQCSPLQLSARSIDPVYMSASEIPHSSSLSVYGDTLSPGGYRNTLGLPPRPHGGDVHSGDQELASNFTMSYLGAELGCGDYHSAGGTLPVGNVGRRRGRNRRGSGRNGGLTLHLTVIGVISAVAVVVSALCPPDPLARIIVFVPPSLRLDAVHLYFRLSHQNDVVTDGWLNQNTTVVRIFDLESVRPTTNSPCSAQSFCPRAYNQNLGGCDASTGECVCERGHDLDRGVCVDINECLTSYNKCPSTATCQNVIGSYDCHCGYGFYGSRKSCKPCSVGCPSGTFESSPCTTFGDRVCIECSKCHGSTYEAKPCSGTTDRQCIHAAHPLLITGDMATGRFLEETYQTKGELKKRKKTPMKPEASSNVFLEDLHNTRNLETTYYVTDPTQAFDFYWDRESGLHVNAGVLDVHIIPEYTDVDHDSDNKYMLSDPNSSEDKAKFREIVREYCRNPIPDYYSITLEISRDRTTAADTVTCDSKDPKKPKCPSWFKDGDVFLQRTANEACQKMGTHPEPLQSADNSIVCTDQSALLRDLFNQSYGPVRPIKFPSKKCRTAMSRCEQCVSQPRCQALEIFARKCCHIDCYTLMDCKLAYSQECTDIPIECAIGDAYRFTIQPVFENIKADHQCHIERHEPKILYELFYDIQIPGVDFKTSKVHRVVHAGAADRMFEITGQNVLDFLTVEHNSGLELEDDFILHGAETEEGSTTIGDSTTIRQRVNYSIHRRGPPPNEKGSAVGSRVAIHEISNRIFVASTQFERPFDYSTSTWTRQTDCRKNVTKFKQPLKRDATFYKNVNVAVQNGSEPFRYFLKSVENPPYIRFNVPGNVSILPYLFGENGPVLLVNSSIVATLELSSPGRSWEIFLSGRMSGCPAYLGVSIISRFDQEEMLRYDMLIRCPTTFNVTFKVANRGQPQPSDKTFEIHLDDLTRDYVIHITQMTFEHNQLDEENSPVVEPEAIKMPARRQEFSFFVFLAIALSTCISLLVFIAVYIYTEAVKEKLVYDASNENDVIRSQVEHISTHQQTTSSYDPRYGPHTTSSFTGQHTSRLCQYLCFVYVIFRLVYSVAFTFTAFYVALMIIIDVDAVALSRVDALQAEKRNLSAILSQSVDEHGRAEMTRQRELVGGMQAACDNYVGELFDSVAAQIDKIQSVEQRLRTQNRNNVTLSSVLRERTRTRLRRLVADLESFRASYRDRLTTALAPSMVTYRAYFEGLFRNDWLNFPQVLFNESSLSRSSEELGTLVELRSACNLTGVAIEFANFMEIQEMEDIQLWPVRFWQRFESRFPHIVFNPDHTLDYSNMPSPCPTSDATSDTTSDFSTAAALSHHTPIHRLDAAHFFTTPQFEDTSLLRPSVHTDEYVVLSPQSPSSVATKQFSGGGGGGKKSEKLSPPSFSLSYFTEEIDGEMLRAIFLLMDGFLFVYRLSLTCLTVRALQHRFRAPPPYECDDRRSIVVGRSAINHHDGSASFSSIKSCDMSSQQRGNHRRDMSSTALDENQHNIYIDPQTLFIQNHTASLPRSTSSASRLIGNNISPGEEEMERSRMEMCPGSGRYRGEGLLGRERRTVRRRYNSFRVVCGRMLENSAFSKVVVLSMLLVMLYGSLRSLVVLINVDDLLTHVNAFGVFVDALAVHVNQTNADVTYDARHFNDALLRAYEGQMNAELLNLQGLLDHFNSGLMEDSLSRSILRSNSAHFYSYSAARYLQSKSKDAGLVPHRMFARGSHEQTEAMNNLVSDICAVRNTGVPGWKCELALSPNLLRLPLLPCNFVPIQPQQFSGFKLHHYVQQLQETFQPCIDAAKNILVKSLYAILILISSALVIHIFGWIVYRCLRVRQHIAGAGRQTAGRMSFRSVPVDSASIQTIVHRVNDGGCVSDCDSDGYDEGRGLPPSPAPASSIYIRPRSAVPPPPPRVPSTVNAGHGYTPRKLSASSATSAATAQSNECKFSETNV